MNINVQYQSIDDGKEVINVKAMLATLLPAGAGGGRVPGHDGRRTPAAAPWSLPRCRSGAAITRVNTVFTYCGHYGAQTCQ